MYKLRSNSLTIEEKLLKLFISFISHKNLAARKGALHLAAKLLTVNEVEYAKKLVFNYGIMEEIINTNGSNDILMLALNWITILLEYDENRVQRDYDNKFYSPQEDYDKVAINSSSQSDPYFYEYLADLDIVNTLEKLMDSPSKEIRELAETIIRGYYEEPIDILKDEAYEMW